MFTSVHFRPSGGVHVENVVLLDETGSACGTAAKAVVHHGQTPLHLAFSAYLFNEAGQFLLTGDLGLCDADGFIRFVGRNDDVITSAGYRIGPAPIEDCLLRHPAVSMAAVVGAPDAARTEIVMAFIVLNAGFVPDETLVRELQQHVRTRLAAHEYPREIRFVDALPMTPTGKVMRKELRARLPGANGLHNQTKP